MHSEIKWAVRPTEPQDAYKICGNRNGDCVEYLHDPNMYSVHQTTKWIENLPKTSKRFTIVNNDDGWNFNWYIGCIRVDHIDEPNHNCYVGMDIATEYRGKGLSYEIYKWLFDYLFNDLNMHVLYLEVLATNERAAHIYKKLGFKPCGFYPHKVFRGGQYIDSLLFSLLRSQWNNANTKAG